MFSAIPYRTLCERTGAVHQSLEAIINSAFADPDIVEEANISRQAFCDKEIGLPKAQALALRYAIDRGVDTTAFVQEFDPKSLRYAYNKLTILVGYVDTAAGKILLGRSLDINLEFYNFERLGCARLPSPMLQVLDLLEPKPEKMRANLLF